jgi:hypothetical protein
MKEKLEEVRAIVAGVVQGNRPRAGLVRAWQLLEQVLGEDWWEDDDVAILAPSSVDDELVGELEPPFPAA